MEQLLQHNHTIMYDDAMSNSKMRASYRVQRKRKKRRLDDAKAMGLGRGIELDPREREKEDNNDDNSHSNRDNTTGDEFRKALESRKDIRDEKSRKKEKSKFLSIRSTSIFGENKISKRSSRTCNKSRSHTAKINGIGVGIGNHRKENSGNNCKEKKKLNISIQG
eukprot:699928_1